MRSLPILAALAASAPVIALPAFARADVSPWPPPITLTAKARVDNAINGYIAAGNAWKGAVVVVIDHGFAYKFFYGTRDGTNPFDASTVVQIGSNTKTFTGTALAYVDHYGIMSKDSKLSVWVTIAAGSPPRTATLMDLADHRSGLPRDPQDPVPAGQVGPYATMTALVQSLSHCASASWAPNTCVAPGSGLYSNYAYEVLGNIISHHLSYDTWSEMNKDLVTDPLGMTHTCLHDEGCNPGFNGNHAHPFAANGTELPVPPTDPIAAPGGGLWSTATDMTTWLRFNLGEPTTSQSAFLDVLRPALRTSPVGNTGFAWNFRTVSFSDGASSTVRWKDGRLQGLVSYIGLADSRDTAVFLFVNRDPIPMSSDPTDPSPGIPVQILGQSILQQFP